jgi:digeranylgeranylglycerophospholipid reductase
VLFRSGNIAGEVAGRAIKAGDTSRSFLMEYEKRWNKRIGRTFRHLRGIREGVLKFNDNTLNDLARVLSQAQKLSLIEIFWSALKNEPKLLLELRHLVSMGWAQ